MIFTHKYLNLKGLLFFSNQEFNVIIKITSYWVTTEMNNKFLLFTQLEEHIYDLHN